MTYTHYGWFGFCPIYLANPYSQSPDLTSRAEWLMPLLKLNVALQQAAIGVCTLMNPEWVPTWKIRLSGKLEKPVRC
jgi:hypothetical protein